MSATASACAGGGVGGQRDLAPRAPRRAPSRRAPTIVERRRHQLVGHPLRAAPRTRRASTPAPVASASTAASAQSSSSAASEPSGFAPSTSRVRGSSCRSTALTGDGTVSRSSRRMPGAHRGVLLGRRREHPHVDRGARVDERREAAHGVPAAGALDDARQLVEVVGPGAQPGALQLAGDRLGDGAAGPARPAAPAARRDPCRARPRCRRRTRRRRSPAGAAGSLSRSNASIGTSTPVRRCSSRCSASQQRFLSRRRASASTARAVSGRGNEVAAQVLRQRADQRGDQLLAQRGHLPGELVAAEPGEHVDRHVHGDAVVVGARLEPVGQRQRQIAGLPGVRLVGVGVVGAQQVVAGERQQVRRLVPLLLPPRVEVPRRHDVGRDAGVVERVDLVVADEQVAAAGPLLDLLEFGAQRVRCRGRSGGGSASRPRRARAG